MTTTFQHRLQQAIGTDYQIERELGGGGMSRVFVATERALQRRVVIKVLPPELAAGVNVDRFRREIQLAAQLQHPHIVPLLSAGDQDGLLWFSMPFIEGESLRGALTKESRLPARDVVRIMHDVVDALAYAHARGIVHRDIKPDNILTSGMHALVTDFGVAKALSAAVPMAGGTTTGMVVGTPAYMAPEQLAADPAADHRVDIYGAGLLAYELVTGRSPFSGSSPQATMAAQLTQMPELPQKFADIPEGLSTIIMHCLEKDAAKRPQSALALLAELDALPAMSASGSIATPRSQRRVWPMIATAAGIAAVALFAVKMLPSTPGNTKPDTLSARDAGPGGRRATTMEVAKSIGGKSHDVKPETIVVYRNSGDSAEGIFVPVVISRAESLAIAEAVRKRLVAADSSKRVAAAAPPTAAVKGVEVAVTHLVGAAQTASAAHDARIFISDDGKSVTLDRAQLLEEVGKIFADSVARVFGRMDTTFGRVRAKVSRGGGGNGAGASGNGSTPGTMPTLRFDMKRPTGLVTPLLAAPTDGRIRVVVTNYSNTTGKRNLMPVGRDIASYLRVALATDQFTVVDDSTTGRASRDLRDPLSIGWGLRADYVVSGMVMQRADSIVLLTQFNDVRDGRFMRVTESSATVSDPNKAFVAALAHVNGWLDTAKVMRTRRGPNGGPQSGGRGREGPPSR